MHVIKERVKGVFAGYFKEVIYGGIDGIVTTFAVVAGFTGAALSSDQTTHLSFAIVLLFGLANLFADAASMGLGNLLSVRSEKDMYSMLRQKERNELRKATQHEINETMEILQSKGFSRVDAMTLTNIYKYNEEYWLDFMMHHEHELSDPRSENEFFTGLATFISFMVFGSIPLLPFIFRESADAATAFTYSAVGTFMALIALGILKWRVIGAKFTTSMLEVIIIGGTAAVLAYFVGTILAT